LAALAFRLRLTVTGAPAEFAATSAGGGTNSAGQILAHIGDLFDWSLTLVRGEEKWVSATPLPWPEEVARVEKSLRAFDAALASGAELKTPAENLVQGPIADALWHTGQLALLRRVAGAPIQSKNYCVAEIREGELSLF
jgi:hypothetical protein